MLILTIAAGVVLGLAIWNFPFDKAIDFLFSLSDKNKKWLKVAAGLTAFAVLFALAVLTSPAEGKGFGIFAGLACIVLTKLL
jgi:hypothetical protein